VQLLDGQPGADHAQPDRSLVHGHCSPVLVIGSGKFVGGVPLGTTGC
jgi:hypothetical protein